MGKIVIKQGDISNFEESLVAHQVNCRGVMGRGVAKSLKDKFPPIYEDYKKFCKENKGNLLGSIRVVKLKDKYVAHLFGQDEYGRNGIHTQYDKLEQCFKKLSNFCTENKIDRIAMPYKIGCGFGGGNWDLVRNMIESIISQEVVLYGIDGNGV